MSIFADTYYQHDFKYEPTLLTTQHQNPESLASCACLCKEKGQVEFLRLSDLLPGQTKATQYLGQAHICTLIIHMQWCLLYKNFLCPGLNT